MEASSFALSGMANPVEGTTLNNGDLSMTRIAILIETRPFNIITVACGRRSTYTPKVK